MIKHLIFTGDTHGGVATISRVGNIQRNMPECKPEETIVVILGDAGLNFYLNNTDNKHKKLLNSMGYHIYCVRGNHEQRPELINSMILVNDENVHNKVWMEPAFPNIRYFVDGKIYDLLGYSALVIGGAYSVDKWYRLARAGYSRDEAETANPKKCGWFKDECLTVAEMNTIIKEVQGESVDFILSHTCPLSWEPNDLFLNCIDQSTVDKSMEVWLDELKDSVNWKYYLFGHYHADRIERPYVEQFYQEYEDVEAIVARWDKYDKTGELDWWLPKSPAFYQDIESEVK